MIIKRYFAKADTWFKRGTECFKVEEMYPGSSLYRGTYVVGSCNPNGYDKYWYKQGYLTGDEVEMNEVCFDRDFYIVKSKDYNEEINICLECGNGSVETTKATHNDFIEIKKLKNIAFAAEQWLNHLEKEGGHFYDGIPGELMDAVEEWKRNK